MTIIANPIYDAVFKFLMEDKKVAKIFLSALLKKDIIDLEMRRHEYTSMEHTRISLFRIDFQQRFVRMTVQNTLSLSNCKRLGSLLKPCASDSIWARSILIRRTLSKKRMSMDKGVHMVCPSFLSTFWDTPWVT